MEQLTLNMIPNGYTPTAHISQYDVGRHIRFNLQNINLAGNETVTLKIRKTNGELVTKTIENHTSYVEYVSEKADCDYSGTANCEIVISKDNTVLGSKNFLMKVEADAYDGAGVVTETASGRIATFDTNMVDVLQSVKCEINAKQDLHGEDKPYPAGGGVNLFDKTNVFEGYIIDTNGNFSTRTGDASTDFISVVGGASYYVKSEQEQGMWGAWYNENKEYISACTGYANRVMTAPTNAKFVRLTVVHNSGNVDTFGINYPATDTEYHPYENVCPIEGYTEANITRCGVNLFDENKLIIARSPYASMTFDKATYLKAGTYTASISNIENATSWRFGFKFFDKSGNIITNAISNGYVSFVATKAFLDIYDNGNVCLQSDDTTGTSVKITLTSDIYIVACIGFGDTGSSTTLDYEIETGNTATAYTPYTGNTYAIAIGQEVFGGQSIILPDRTYFHATHYGVEYDGTEDGWSWYGDYQQASIALPYPAKYEIDNITYKCNRLTPVLNQSRPQNVGNYSSLISSGANGAFSTPETSLANFKTWLSSNRIQFVYELATPFDIDLTPVQIEALIGINNVRHDANGNTEVKYLYDA